MASAPYRLPTERYSVIIANPLPGNAGFQPAFFPNAAYAYAYP
jgi:hypothetical protein